MNHDLLATLFLFMLAIVPIVWLIVSYSRTQYTPMQYVLYCLATFLVRFQWRASVPSRSPFPRGRGAILVANHRSSIDPFFVQVSADRPVHWMVAKEYCEHPKFRWFLRQTEAIPTGRGGIDTAAVKLAIRLAQQGEYVAMFPEGRINTSKDQFMLPVRPGAVMVALRAGVPLLPCYIQDSPYDGTPASPLRMTARVRVRYGTPIEVAEYQGRDQDDQLVREILLRCVREIARLAGRDDYIPRLAGRQWMSSSEPGDEATLAG